MANELVKYDSWQGSKISKADYEKALSVIKQAAVPRVDVVKPVVMPQRTAELTTGPGQIVDLPRVCAVHDRPYAARYIRGDDGRFHLGSMIAITEAIYMRQYAGNGNAGAVSSDAIGEETCPLCGAFGHGSVLCSDCKKEVCYGRTSGRYFRCRESCRGKGVMKPEKRVQHGVTPVDMGWR
jgi:hypothetical protein